MPSIALDLGKYVTLRKRADGTCRVFFQVPARLRPSGWPSLIPLPRTGARKGDLADAAEVALIQTDAKALYEALQAQRRGVAHEETGRTFKALIRAYQKGERWKGVKPRTRKSYQTYVNHAQALADHTAKLTGRQPDPATMTRANVDAWLAAFDAQPVTKKQLRKILRLLFETARDLGWRNDNPCDGMRLRTPKSQVTIWEQSDVDAYVAAALAPGHHARDRKSIALMILLEWEIGQRLTDARGFRPGAEYDPEAGEFRFDQSKTGAAVSVPISSTLNAMLKEAGEDQLFLFRNEATGKAYTEEGLSKAFAWVRKAAEAKGARYLQMRWLRHSCVVHLARAGCTVAEIAAITGHSIQSVTKILATYLPRDATVARNAQVKRGLVAAG